MYEGAWPAAPKQTSQTTELGAKESAICGQKEMGA